MKKQTSHPHKPYLTSLFADLSGEVPRNSGSSQAVPVRTPTLMPCSSMSACCLKKWSSLSLEHQHVVLQLHLVGYRVQEEGLEDPRSASPAAHEQEGLGAVQALEKLSCGSTSETGLADRAGPPSTKLPACHAESPLLPGGPLPRAAGGRVRKQEGREGACPGSQAVGQAPRHACCPPRPCSQRSSLSSNPPESHAV